MDLTDVKPTVVEWVDGLGRTRYQPAFSNDHALYKESKESWDYNTRSSVKWKYLTAGDTKDTSGYRWKKTYTPKLYSTRWAALRKATKSLKALRIDARIEAGKNLTRKSDLEQETN